MKLKTKMLVYFVFAVSMAFVNVSVEKYLRDFRHLNVVNNPVERLD
jgi:hypothetical protein